MKTIEVVEGVNYPERKTLTDCLVQILMFGRIHSTVPRITDNDSNVTNPVT